MTGTVTQTPIQKLITFAITFSQLADHNAQRQGRHKSAGAQDAAWYNRVRANAFRLAAYVFEDELHDLQEATNALKLWISLADNAPCIDAYRELLREAERLQREEEQVEVGA